MPVGQMRGKWKERERALPIARDLPLTPVLTHPALSLKGRGAQPAGLQSAPRHPGPAGGKLCGNIGADPALYPALQACGMTKRRACGFTLIVRQPAQDTPCVQPENIEEGGNRL